MTYDELTDLMAASALRCSHKVTVVRWERRRSGICRHSPDECEYKRILVAEYFPGKKIFSGDIKLL